MKDMKKNKKTLVTVITENYRDYFFAFLSSVNKNLDNSYVLIIIHDGITESMRATILKKNNNYIKIIFFNIYESEYKDIFVGDISSPVYWRLIAPLIVEYKNQNILYIDADTLIRSSIDELFTYNLNSTTVGAVVDYLKTVNRGVSNYRELGLDGNTAYFNAGVLLINPDKYIKNNIFLKVIDIVMENKNFLIVDNKWPQNDQYGLNVALYENWCILPREYNYGSELDFNQSAKIVHFIGNGKPGSPTCNAAFSKEFDFYKNNPKY
jgi:lipopolysaccharide biosynthesis glycosyltransferase